MVRQRKFDDGEESEDEVLMNKLKGPDDNNNAEEPAQDHIEEVSFDLVDGQLLNLVVKKKN